MFHLTCIAFYRNKPLSTIIFSFCGLSIALDRQVGIAVRARELMQLWQFSEDFVMQYPEIQYKCTFLK